LVAPRYLVATARGADLDRGNTIESPDILSERNAGGDRSLGRDMGRVGFEAALVDPKQDTAAAEGLDIHVGRPRDERKKPYLPSKTDAGPVSPARASVAAKTALRPASASATPFQSDNACTRVWAIAM